MNVVALIIIVTKNTTNSLPFLEMSLGDEFFSKETSSLVEEAPMVLINKIIFFY